MEVVILPIIDGFVITCFGYTTVIVKRLTENNYEVKVVPQRPISKDCEVEFLHYSYWESTAGFVKRYIQSQFESLEISK